MLKLLRIMNTGCNGTFVGLENSGFYMKKKHFNFFYHVKYSHFR